MLQVVEREHGTIKESIWELCDKGGVRRISMSQGSRPCMGCCAAVQVGCEVNLVSLFMMGCLI